jgi:photosystem II stability/assembly factor-like uncharacterized protein
METLADLKSNSEELNPVAGYLDPLNLVDGEFQGRRALLQTGAATAAGLSLGSLPEATRAAGLKEWKVVQLPQSKTSDEPPILFDIDFDTKENTGFIVGNRGTVYKSTDGGISWKSLSFGGLDQDEDVNYRFVKTSFKDGEGWIIGKPAILLYTRDSGKSWVRVPLSPKLPGDPTSITALGPGQAEMATSVGAIYTTINGGQNWKAEVKETIDATLNRVSSSGVQGASYYAGSVNSIVRDASGSYLAVSSRGNFYLTYQPGDEFWVPHNRESSRRITSMGFVKESLSEGLWLTAAGGDISKTPKGKTVNLQEIAIQFDKLKIRSGGYGLLDIAFLPDSKTAWAVGGAGTIFVSTNGGESWTKDRVADDLPSNLYKVKFFGDQGFILGSNGVLLRNA